MQSELLKMLHFLRNLVVKYDYTNDGASFNAEELDHDLLNTIIEQFVKECYLYTLSISITDISRNFAQLFGNFVLSNCYFMVAFFLIDFLFIRA